MRSEYPERVRAEPTSSRRVSRTIAPRRRAGHTTDRIKSAIAPTLNLVGFPAERISSCCLQASMPTCGTLRLFAQCSRRDCSPRFPEYTKPQSAETCPHGSTVDERRGHDPIVRAMPSTASGSTTYPLRPGRTSSATQPHRCDTMTGRPDAIASFTTNPMFRSRSARSSRKPIHNRARVHQIDVRPQRRLPESPEFAGATVLPAVPSHKNKPHASVPAA